ncbi:UNVERIFIED_CONTAM: hypothetical protein PYX00_007940 [Menopon gallinae]|uniref:Palmitoyl-protein thioesterase 1 n=1 Tax=Menopon gallinae TaxID=328185 RepID=A0AAW2HL03_9NEOP
MIKTGVFLLCFAAVVQASVPIVLWHGMGDSCCFFGSLGRIINVLKDKIPGAEVFSLKFGDTVLQDIESSYFLNANRQVELACETLRSNSKLQDGYNAIGFSQGAQFLRAVAERCPTPPMKTLISIGGQHQGVYGLPKCAQPNPRWCDIVRKMLNHGAYIGWVQNGLVQAQYWHDPLNEKDYKTYSIFLADINNEKASKNESYIENFKKLEKLVLVRFEKDSMVNPRESSWFGFYAPGQSRIILPYNETDLYKNNLIGLKDLVEENKVTFLSVDDDHLHFTIDWFTEEIIKKFLIS